MTPKGAWGLSAFITGLFAYPVSQMDFWAGAGNVSGLLLLICLVSIGGLLASKE